MRMIAIVQDPATDAAAYLGEMLSMWGLPGWSVLPADDDRWATAPTVVVPPGTEVAAEALRSALRNGTHVVLVAPRAAVLASLELDGDASYADDGSLGYLRLTRPLLHAFSHHALPVLGRRAPAPAVEGNYMTARVHASLPAEARVWAYLYEPGPVLTDRPGIWSVVSGEGTVTVFAYDLVECYRDLRQGRPRHAGWRPAFDDICRPAWLFGPDWVGGFRGAHVPVADFHPMLLLRLIETFRPAPLPRLWTLPAGARAAVLVSGDEDGCAPDHTADQCAFLRELEAHMTLYIEMHAPQATPGEVRDWIRAGHSFSAHPYPAGPGAGDAGPRGDPLPALEACVRQYRERYGLPVRSVRNHRTFWQGYADIPRLWERLGIAMDTNYISSTIGNRDFRGFYSAPAAALPMPFCDEAGRLIRVLQQPVAGSDDAEFSGPGQGPKGKHVSAELFRSYGRRLHEHTLVPLALPFAFIFHPGNFCSFARDAEEGFLRDARAAGAALLSDYEWLDFWEVRRRVDMEACAFDNATLSCRLTGAPAGGRVGASFPQCAGGAAVNVQVNGRATEVTPVEHFGEPRLLVALPEGTSEVTVTYA